MSLINSLNGSYCGLIKLYKCVAFITTPNYNSSTDGQPNVEEKLTIQGHSHSSNWNVSMFQEMRKLKSHFNTKLDKHKM